MNVRKETQNNENDRDTIRKSIFLFRERSAQVATLTVQREVSPSSSASWEALLTTSSLFLQAALIYAIHLRPTRGIHPRNPTLSSQTFLVKVHNPYRRISANFQRASDQIKFTSMFSKTRLTVIFLHTLKKSFLKFYNL